MGWESRRGRCYYYKNTRVGDRVVKEYFGSGNVARLAERRDLDVRRGETTESRAIAAERDRLTPAAAAMTALDRAAGGLIEAALLAAGFHQHRRTWRKNGPPRSHE